ncbi:MAG: DUF4382 domain-containing protein [Deferrisomatales bacterium]|nr:DUF4382 domain-containing protein [Deferrisomatales bacterium]
MRWTIGRRLLRPVLAVCFALLSGCGGGGDSGSTDVVAQPAGAGRVAILLTDAPTAAFDEVNVTITEAYLLGDDGPVQVFGSVGETHNLLDLRDSAKLLFDVAEVPVGCYDKIRLVVTRVELVRYERDAAGDVVFGKDDLPAPAAGFPAEAKLSSNKIDLNPQGTFCVVPGETLVLQLDMEANESIHVVEKKGGTEYNFRPVVFVTVLDGGDDVLGKLVRLSGRVSGVGTDRFTLCETTAEPLARQAAGDPVCTEVLAPQGGTSLFELDGTPIDRAAEPLLETVIFEGDFVRVVGRYTLLTASDGDWDEVDRSLGRFQAEVVEVGVSPQTWGRYAGEITEVGGLPGCEGVFRFLLDAGQGLTGQLDISVHLFTASRIFDRDGAALGCSALQVGARAVVDAVVYRVDGTNQLDQLNAAVVVTGSVL